MKGIERLKNKNIQFIYNHNNQQPIHTTHPAIANFNGIIRIFSRSRFPGSAAQHFGWCKSVRRALS